MYQSRTRSVNRWRYWYSNRRIKYRYQKEYTTCWCRRWNQMKMNKRMHVRWNHLLMATPRIPRKIHTSIMLNSSLKSCWACIDRIKRDWPRRRRTERRRWRGWPGVIDRRTWKWRIRNRRQWMWSNCRWLNRSRSRWDINFQIKPKLQKSNSRQKSKTSSCSLDCKRALNFTRQPRSS